MKLKRILICCAVFGAVLPGWGDHDTIGRCILKKLPPEWQERFRPEWQNDYLKATHLPDREKLELLGPEEAEWFRANMKVVDTYVFHREAYAFAEIERLVHVLRTGNDRAVFMYLASISHTLADPAACNHDPIIHLPRYIWCKCALDVMPKGLRSLPLDFEIVERDAVMRAVLEKRLAELKVSEPDSDLTPTQLYAKISRWNVQAAEPCYRVSQTILENGFKWAATGDVEAERVSADALCDIGLWGVERTLYVFAAARRWAEKGEIAMPVAEYHAIAQAGATNELLVLDRRIADDSFARPFLPKPDRPCRFACLYDTTAHMAGSVFSAPSRPFGCQLVGSLQKIRPDLNPGLYNARDFAKSGLDPAVTPYLCVFRGPSGYRRYDVAGFWRHLAKYRQEGGKVIWVNGNPPAAVFGREVESAFLDGKRRDGYGMPVYPGVELKEVTDAKGNKKNAADYGVLMQSALAWTGAGEPHAWPYRRKPQGLAGWMWQGSPGYFDAAALPSGATGVVELRAPGRTYVTGVKVKNAVYLPYNTVFPYCITDEKPQLVPFRLSLDSAGEAFVQSALAALEQDR